MMKYKKIAVICPGQGSQYVGMGSEFYEAFPFVREIYDEAGDVLGYDLADACFKKHALGMIRHKVDLNKTLYTQPAILTTSYACYRVLKDACGRRGIQFDFFLTAGHSLGEYTALLIAGAMDFKTCVELVRKRAKYMTEVGKGYPDAGLMAILGRKEDLDYGRICALCKDYDVYITLNNTRRQIVVGGSKMKLSELSKELKNDGMASTLLKVEGPFHTPIMRPGAERFKKALDQVRLEMLSKPIVANVSTDVIVDPRHIREEAYHQIYQPVNWRGSVEKMIDNGADLFIEVGPKRVLSNMLREIHPDIPALNVEDMESLEKTLHGLSGREVGP